MRKLGLLTLLVVFANVNAFFSFFKSSPVEAEDVGGIRGVPGFLLEKYENKETFTCGNGEKTILASEINDNYCDCGDGSDEPGTSACSGLLEKGVFYCRNSGYRTLTIPSSRVDDGICDCCDGSDEKIVAKCPNVCATLAAKEREMITKMTKTYIGGRQILLQAEDAMKQNLTIRASQYESLKARADESTVKMDTIRDARYAAKKELDEYHDGLKQETFAKARELIRIDSMSTRELVQFVYALFNLAKISENDINDLKRQTENANNIHNENNHVEDQYNEHDHEHDYHEHDYDHEDGYHDGYHEEDHHDNLNFHGEDYHEDNIVHDDLDQGHEQADVETDRVPCHILEEVNNDARLELLCQNGDNLDNAKTFIVESLFRFKRPFSESQVLVGYYDINHTLEGAEAYGKSLLQGELEPNSCPSDFAAASRGTCDIVNNLHELYALFDGSLESLKPELDIVKKYQIAENEFYSYQTEHHILMDDKDDAERAHSDMESHKEHLALLMHKNQCFEIQGGAYVYSVCMLDQVTQSDDGSTVNLGSYESVTESDDGTLVMRFTDGDYCHAFGPRSAEVKMTCGLEYKVISAREPSTCFYSFEMESPVACTEKFARAQGLQV